MKLWFFRTPKGQWGISRWSLRRSSLEYLDATGDLDCAILYGNRPKDWPAHLKGMAKGACIPVTLRAEG